MKKLNESYLEIKKSKFIGILYEVNSTNDVEVILNYPDDEFEKQSKKKCYLKFYVDCFIQQ